MPDPFLLIDGYNLMHTMGLMRRRYGPGEFEKWRRRFLRYLSSALSPRERERTTVVFDSPSQGNSATSRETISQLQVLFAPAHLQADDVLEELIARHSAPRQILLISSDRRLKKAVRQRRGKAVNSETFAAELRRRTESATGDIASENHPPDHRKRKGLATAAETAEWVDFFGDIPEADQLRRAPNEFEDFDIEALQRELEDEFEEESHGEKPEQPAE